MPDNRTEEEIQIWDMVVRIGHWVLVAAFFVAYLTEEELLEVHEWAGYAVAAYVVVRVVWGFVGPKHARFADFWYGPFAAVSYLGRLLRGQAARYLGHSPAGAAMVFALLLMLTGTVVTGMAEMALAHGEGPFALFMERQSVVAVTAAEGTAAEGAELDEGGDERGERGEESAMLELHELFANITLLLIVLHVAGVIAASLAHKENLVRAMITGRKRA
jgi:cytochrome b